MQTVISPVNIKERKSLDMRAGDTVRVHQKIQEKGKTRLQVFEGLVLAVKHGKEAGSTFTVRRVASGVGVEKIFPLYSPSIDHIDTVKRSKVRRAKLYHIRDKAAKEIRRQMRNIRTVSAKPADDKSAEEELNEADDAGLLPKEGDTADTAEAQPETTTEIISDDTE